MDVFQAKQSCWKSAVEEVPKESKTLIPQIGQNSWQLIKSQKVREKPQPKTTNNSRLCWTNKQKKEKNGASQNLIPRFFNSLISTPLFFFLMYLLILLLLYTSHMFFFFFSPHSNNNKTTKKSQKMCRVFSFVWSSPIWFCHPSRIWIRIFFCIFTFWPNSLTSELLTRE